MTHDSDLQFLYLLRGRFTNTIPIDEILSLTRYTDTVYPSDWFKYFRWLRIKSPTRYSAAARRLLKLSQRQQDPTAAELLFALASCDGGGGEDFKS